MSWRFVKKLQDAQDASVGQHDHRDAMACPAPGTWWELWPAGPATVPGRNLRTLTIRTYHDGGPVLLWTDNDTV